MDYRLREAIEVKMSDMISMTVPSDHQALWVLLSHIKEGQAIQYGILDFGKPSGNPFSLIFDDPEHTHETCDEMNRISMKLIQDLVRDQRLKCTSRPSGIKGQHIVYAIALIKQTEAKPPT